MRKLHNVDDALRARDAFAKVSEFKEDGKYSVVKQKVIVYCLHGL